MLHENSETPSLEDILQENILHAKQYRVILREKEMEKKEDRSFFWRFHSAFPSSSNRFDVAVVMTAGLEQNGTSHGQHQHHACVPSFQRQV